MHKIIRYLISFLREIIRSLFLKHFLFAFITVILLFFIWLKFLDIYTLHDNYIKVPNYINIELDDLDSITEANNLRYIIIDSIFDRNRPKGIVVNQDPEPFTDVKKNRRIYLTINSLESRKVPFPNIYDLSLRQAIRKLEKLDLEVGDLEYRADIATNKVLDFKVNGVKIIEGEELYVGTVVDLVVGKGLSQERVIIPNLIGLNRVEANIILKSNSLNIGSEIFLSSIEDSSLAIIYKQYPESNDEKEINIGSSIDLYFKSKSSD